MATKCALYHRTSTIDQDMTLARGELQKAAALREMEVVLDIEETGSGARNDRPGLLRVMEAARRGKVDAVLVYKLDRFGRSALDVLTNVRALTDAGVRFVCISQGIDARPGGDPMSQLVLTMLAAIAEFERGLIRERTLLGLAKAKAKGHRAGPKLDPYGPRKADVHKVRSEGKSWRETARILGCSVGMARSRAEGSHEQA